MIDLLPLIFWMSELFCQFSVICEKKDSRCRLVESADRINPLRTVIPDKLKNCMIGMRIFNCCYIPFGLIHKDIYFFLSFEPLVFIPYIVGGRNFYTKVG